jgi:hypothetical protein
MSSSTRFSVEAQEATLCCSFWFDICCTTNEIGRVQHAFWWLHIATLVDVCTVLYRLLQAVRYSEFLSVIMVAPQHGLLHVKLVCCLLLLGAIWVPPLRSVISADRLPLELSPSLLAESGNGGPLVFRRLRRSGTA